MPAPTRNDLLFPQYPDGFNPRQPSGSERSERTPRRKNGNIDPEFPQPNKKPPPPARWSFPVRVDIRLKIVKRISDSLFEAVAINLEGTPLGKAHATFRDCELPSTNAVIKAKGDLRAKENSVRGEPPFMAFIITEWASIKAVDESDMEELLRA